MNSSYPLTSNPVQWDSLSLKGQTPSAVSWGTQAQVVADSSRRSRSQVPTGHLQEPHPHSFIRAQDSVDLEASRRVIAPSHSGPYALSAAAALSSPTFVPIAYGNTQSNDGAEQRTTCQQNNSSSSSHGIPRQQLASRQIQKPRTVSEPFPQPSQSNHQYAGAARMSTTNRVYATAGYAAGGEDVDYLRKNIKHLQRVNRDFESQVSQLRNQSESLEGQISQYKCLYEQIRDCQGNGGLEIDSLYQQLNACMMLKDTLFKENTELRGKIDEQRESLNDELQHAACVICKDKLASLVCMPCKHLALCTHCGKQEGVDHCPICRTRLQDKMQIYTP